MFFNDLDFKNGEIVFNDFDISPSIAFEDQSWSLKQDMLLVSYCGGVYGIDIGWWPDFDISGEFVIKVIKGDDWDNPVIAAYSKNLNELKLVISYLDELIPKLYSINIDTHHIISEKNS